MLAPVVRVVVVGGGESQSVVAEDIEQYGLYCWDAIRYMGVEAFLAQDMNMGFMSKALQRAVAAAGELDDESYKNPQAYLARLAAACGSPQTAKQ